MRRSRLRSALLVVVVPLALAGGATAALIQRGAEALLR